MKKKLLILGALAGIGAIVAGVIIRAINDDFCDCLDDDFDDDDDDDFVDEDLDDEPVSDRDVATEDKTTEENVKATSSIPVE